jgi:hypothetical protein
MFQRAVPILVTLAVVLACLPALAEFQAGVASVNVTPDPLLPITGGLGTPIPVKDKAGELEVRALVLADNDTRVAIVSAPFIAFPEVLIKMVAEQVEGVPAENLVIGATHTHSAPDTYAFIDQNGKCTADLDYVKSVCANTAQAINDAVSNLQPASIKIAEDKIAERIAYNYYAPELYDRRCNVLQAVGADGKPFATLVNYAIHPEVLGPKSGLLSPDMVGPLYDRVAELGGGMCVFMNGAQGGMVTADCRGEDDKDVQTWEECIRIGNLLAEESLRILEDAPVQDAPDLWCGTSYLTLPVDNPGFQVIMNGSPLDYEIGEDMTVKTRLNLINVGTAQMLNIPGEAMPNIGYYLKRNMNGEQNFLLGLTNDAFGYIITKEDFGAFDRYDYITRTSLGEQTADLLMDASLSLVNHSPKPAASN